MSEIGEGLLDELERLLDNCCPAPWTAERAVPGLHRFVVASTAYGWHVYPPTNDVTHGTSAWDDAKAIAALRNAAPQLITAARESAKLAAEYEALRVSWVESDRLRGQAHSVAADRLLKLRDKEHENKQLTARAEAAEARVRELLPRLTRDEAIAAVREAEGLYGVSDTDESEAFRLGVRAALSALAEKGAFAPNTKDCGCLITRPYCGHCNGTGRLPDTETMDDKLDAAGIR
jgi:hypothetical protein